MKINRTVLIVAAVCIALAACSKKNVKEGPSDTGAQANTASTQGISGPTAGGKYTPADLETDSCLRQRVVYFDFDKDALRPEFQAIVACHAKYLVDRPQAHMRLEGNTDERGSRQYNLGLGERRGDAVLAAIRGNGASAAQMEVVSYGEERPVCTESNEDCWAKNRRVEIVYTAK